MKKTCIFLVCLLGNIYGLYYGSPSLPDTSKEGVFISKECPVGIKVGFQADYVLDKSLKVASQRSAQSLEVFKYYLEQGVLIFNFINRFEVYGSMGAMQFHIEPRTTGIIRQDYDTHYRFSWGLGGRAILFEFSKAALGIDFKYQASSPPFSCISVNATPTASIGNSKFRYREWQIGLGLSYALELFTPYIGALYNQSAGQFKYLPKTLLPNHKRHFSMKSRKKFGMAVGTTLSTGSSFELDLEARMIDETALSAAANFRF